MNEFPVLKTDRLLLREFHPTDAPAVFDSFSQEAVMKYINRGPMQSIQEAEKLVEVRASLFGRGIGIRWAITLRENLDSVIGSCGYYKLDKGNHSVETGYDLHSAFWRQGLMTEALTAVINFAYSDQFFFVTARLDAIRF